MTAVGYIFTGLMVVQLAGHLRDFLQKGWNGDLQGGGKSLAKGLAAGAIEHRTREARKLAGQARMQHTPCSAQRRILIPRNSNASWTP